MYPPTESLENLDVSCRSTSIIPIIPRSTDTGSYPLDVESQDSGIGVDGGMRCCGVVEEGWVGLGGDHGFGEVGERDEGVFVRAVGGSASYH